MSTATALQLMTAEELLALPDDGTERDLIEGQLRERPMTRRNRRHTRSTTRVGRFLDAWVDTLPLRGEVLSGEAGFRLQRDPDTTVGIDLAYVSPELAAATPDDVFLIDGAPVLAVEILSPSDTHEDITEKIHVLLAHGVRVVWIVDPDLRTITVHRPDDAPVLFNATQELVGEPELPGLRFRVSDLFAR